MTAAKERRLPLWAKFAVGLAAALGAGWINHGPLGRGEAFIGQLEAAAQRVVEREGVPGVSARMQREPLARTVIMSGPADEFQRNGMGSLPGFDRLMLAIPGVARVEWANPPPERSR